MRLIDAEAHGTWLLGGNGLWHGGIHISDVSNPLSALKPDTAATGEPVPLQFMADGTIAAYRINNDYLKGTYKGQQLRYSSTFVLVKSQCQPDPQKKESWLEFYCLYMHLAPVNDYPGSPCYKVKTGHGGILLHRYIPGKNGLPEGQESGDHATYWIPPKISGNRTLNAGDRFVSSRTGRFYVTNNGQPVLTTFGLVRLLEGNKPGNEQYWVTLDPDLMESDGEIQMLMPEWMQKAKAKGIFDSVQTVDETEEWKVSAGTPVGFMGCEDYPGEGSGEIEREWFVHLEVLSTDPNMPKFLSNPAGVKGEKRTILAPKGIILYTRQAVPGQEVFTATAATLGAQRVLPREATTPVTDESQQWWFNITGTGWLPQKDVEEAGQYDLLKLGFQPLEENSSGDMTYSPYEGWVPEAFDSISRAAEQGDEWLYEQVPPFYRVLMAEMDQDGDGKVTEEEIRQALTVREPLVRNVVNRLTVRHHSEWYGGRSTGRWEGFYKDLDTEEVAYCEKWQLDLEWMSGVSPFNSDDAVWHFHPVVFLNAINNSYYPKTPVNNELIPLEFLRFYNGDTIDDADYENAARTLQCEVAAIKAVAKTETGSSGSYFKFEQEDDYVPSILFERHHFHRYTNGVYDSQPDISNSRSGGYGTRSEQYQKLLRAYVLDKQAALKSASWGKFQILASNYQAAGYSSPEEFIISISESEKNHLAAFINFIKSNPVLLRAIRDKDWLNFALCYNGQSQRGYDDRIRASYEQYR